TTKTEHGAWRTTLSAVVPRKVPHRLEWPLCPRSSTSIFGLLRVLHQAMGWMADALLCLDLNAIFHALGNRLVAELFEHCVAAFAFFVGFTGRTGIPRQLLDKDHG